jgi:hypothetical protein
VSNFAQTRPIHKSYPQLTAAAFAPTTQRCQPWPLKRTSQTLSGQDRVNPPQREPEIVGRRLSFSGPGEPPARLKKKYASLDFRVSIASNAGSCSQLKVRSSLRRVGSMNCHARSQCENSPFPLASCCEFRMEVGNQEDFSSSSSGGLEFHFLCSAVPFHRPTTVLALVGPCHCVAGKLHRAFV